jgi:hypothetical protein
VLDRKELKDIDDQTLIAADVARKAINQVYALVLDLLATRLPRQEAKALVEKLTTGTWTHDYPITAHEAKALGLPVRTDMPPEIYQFLAFFPQPTRTLPAVEYVPPQSSRRSAKACKPTPSARSAYSPLLSSEWSRKQ